MLKNRATREELFEEDMHSLSWAAHQLWRIERLMSQHSKAKGIMMKDLRLAFCHKCTLELQSREGNRVIYQPSGVIEKMHIPERDDQTMTFDVSWVDPWEFFHTDTVTFLEIRFEILDHLSFQRKKKVIEAARLQMMAKVKDNHEI